jgi:hypothetical protein
LATNQPACVSVSACLPGSFIAGARHRLREPRLRPLQLWQHFSGTRQTK